MQNEISDPTAACHAPDLEWIEGDMPYSTAFGDHFYCRSDGRAECGHVFLGANGLPERFASESLFEIGELGFGTGLNFCETWRQWKLFDDGGEKSVRHLHFTSFELYPMDGGSIDKALSRWPEIDAERRALLAIWPDRPTGEVRLELTRDVTLTVMVGDALKTLLTFPRSFDAWYLDGFAPSRNPALWSEELMRQVYEHTEPGGTFATYAAAGFVRRNLVAAGFAVERRPGFAGKREMLCGRK